MTAQLQTGAEDFVVDFKPNPIQGAFIRSRAEADCWFSRFGEGKSCALAWKVFFHAQAHPNLKPSYVIVRDTLRNLERTTMKEFFEWFPPGVAGRYRKDEATFIFELGGLEGSEVVFIGLDDEKSAQKLASIRLAGAMIDEPAPTGESGGVPEMIFSTLIGRMRQKGMKWYTLGLATNSPDETHWTYKVFEDPGTEPSPPDELPEMQESGYRLWMSDRPENLANLPTGYYERMRRKYTAEGRTDLISRFIDGRVGFQQSGKPVTPNWSDRLHLTQGLLPHPRAIVKCMWDFGHTPTCLISQDSPMGTWDFFYALVGSEMGVEDLIELEVKRILLDQFRGLPIEHTGDPNGATPEQTRYDVTPATTITSLLGGTWLSGPVSVRGRVRPANVVLSRTVGDAGLVQVDRDGAKLLWQALRGGWKYKKSSTGTVSREPLKDEHSHPGDCFGYGAAAWHPITITDGRPKKHAPRGAKTGHRRHAKTVRSSSRGVGLLPGQRQTGIPGVPMGTERFKR